MKLVMTVMVRDEIDIIAAMLEHHLAQGVDLIIATDNGSVDGTAEVLQRYADLGVLELHHDPVFRKQQHAVVTGMARWASTEHGADWVLNADADEFWVPVDKALTLHRALEGIPLALNAFTAPVTNLVGPPAMRGSGIDRLLWRDHRSQVQLNDVGIFAQPTSDAVHRGDPNVVVAQGNHFVSLESTGQPDPAYALEVLHLPWRSWSQLEQKVVHAGRAYEANPNLKPSKNHHGMADYRRYQAGRLEYAFLLRQPLERATWLPVRPTACSPATHGCGTSCTRSRIARGSPSCWPRASMPRPTSRSTRASTNATRRSAGCSWPSNGNAMRPCAAPTERLPRSRPGSATTGSASAAERRVPSNVASREPPGGSASSRPARSRPVRRPRSTPVARRR